MNRRRTSRDWLTLGKKKPRKTVQARHFKPRALTQESLESRALLSSIPVQFNISADVVARGVYAEVSGTLTGAYINNQGVHLGTTAANSYVYYNGAIGDYAQATSTTSSFTFQLSGNGAIINLPNTVITSGQIVIGVGSPPIVSFTATGVSTPVAATNPTNYFGLFEYSVTNVAGTNQLDIDMSEVDQTGFPFFVYTTPSAPTPADAGVGIRIQRGDMFNLYTPYIQSQGATASLYQQSLTAGTPYRILAPQNILVAKQSPTLNGLTQANYSSGGSLVVGRYYYYWVTATNQYGESTYGSYTTALPYNKSSRFGNIPQQTVTLTWNPFNGPSGYPPTGYKIYRNSVPDPTTAGLIGTSSTTSYPDYGGGRIGGAPPNSSYTYNPLNSYFNNAISTFFGHYTTPNSFTINRDGYTFTGNTQIAYAPGNGYTYVALVLTSTSLPGQTFVIYQPYFNTNTNMPGAPPPPPGVLHTDQSPGAMLLACDGVFNTGSGTISDLENSVAAAFNRGIATNFSITPSNWAAAPALLSATGATNTITGSGVPQGTYYYVITAVNASGETTGSLERMATVGAGQNSVNLTWTPEVSPTQYNIYRSTTQGSGYQYVGFQTNPIGQTTSYTDSTTSTTSQAPTMFYAPGSTANWYSAFLHTNWTNNPTSGVSVNGLAYGFPYDDQGNDSTNFQQAFTNVYVYMPAWPASQQSTGPASVQIVTQPNSGYVGDQNSIAFQVYNSQGTPYYGVANVVVDVLGAQGGRYTVATNPQTGIGRLTLTNGTTGFSMFRVRIDNGASVDSKMYQVLSPHLPGKPVVPFYR